MENTYCSRGHWKDKVMIMTAEWEGVRAKQNVHCFGEYYPTGLRRGWGVHPGRKEEVRIFPRPDASPNRSGGIG